jgi:outer membrane lipoprotein carrier protein
MKQKILLLLLLNIALYADITNIHSFEADFTQNITDDHNKTIHYQGHIIAQEPQYAFWSYTKPVRKDVYISDSKYIIVEPDLEQVIIKNIRSKFDLFALIQHAQKIKNDKYLAHYGDTTFFITLHKNRVASIAYRDEFENSVTINFTNQKQNITLNKERFEVKIPDEYDVIRE